MRLYFFGILGSRKSAKTQVHLLKQFENRS